MLNSTVLMSDAAHFSTEQQINPYYADSPVDLARAQAEHNDIRRSLEAAGVNVLQTSSPVDSQDGVYTANWALVRGTKAVLARLPDARKSEESWAQGILEARGIEVTKVPEDWRFSGQGDALPCGNYLFCGQGYRSDARAQSFAAKILDFTPIQLQTVPQLNASGQPVINASSGWEDSFYYDIDLALSILRAPTAQTKGLIAYCPAAFTTRSNQIIESLDFVDRITVSEKEAMEAFACNLVSTGTNVVMSDSAPQLKQAIESYGLTVHSPSISELSKGGGYIRCTTLTLA